jgi:hypothetical protein
MSLYALQQRYCRPKLEFTRSLQVGGATLRSRKKNCPAAFPTPSADDKWQNAAQKNEFLADREHIPSLEQQQAVVRR